MHSAQSNWDFWSSLPEALHQVTIVMSDRGIPASYRHMHGFGSHTFSLINEDNERVWVKFHLKTNQGIKNLTDAEAGQIIAGDRESHQRDPVQRHRARRVPQLALLRPDHGRGHGEELQGEPVRHHEDVEPEGVSADRGGHA